MGKVAISPGDKYNYLTVIEEVEPRISKSGSKIRRFVCKCDCGNLSTVSLSGLGRIKSCGCIAIKRSTKHGDRHTRLYGIWIRMRQRCHNPKSSGAKWYHDKGIRVCDEWHDYLTFKQWAMANGYSNNLSIDRVDHNGNYEPGNCRWITMSENIRRSNIKKTIKYKGKMWSLTTLLETLGKSQYYSLIKYRIYHAKWPIEKAVDTPKRAW